MKINRPFRFGRVPVARLWPNLRQPDLLPVQLARVCAAICFVAGVARGAEGILSNGVGARSMGMGGADVGFAQGPLSALGVNPAGLSLLKGPVLDAGFTAAIPTGEFTSRFGSGGDLENRFEIGPDFAFGMPLPSSPVSVGVGLIPAVGLAAHWRYLDPPGGADGGTTYGFQRDNSEVSLLRTAVGASVAFSRWFSAGATLGIDYNENLLQTPYVFQSQPVLRGLKTLLDLQTSGWGLNGGFGVLIRPSDTVQIGLSYTGPTSITSRGSASGNAWAQLQALKLNARSDFNYSAEVDTKFPQMVSGGVSWQFQPKWRLALQIDWVNWSDAFDVLPVKLSGGNNGDINGLVGSSNIEDDVPLHWRDQVVYRVGLEYAVTEKLRLRGGYAYGRSPVPNETLTPLTAAIPEHTLTVGAGYRWQCLDLDLAYQWDLPVTRTLGPSDLRSGEYSFSSTQVAVHWLSLTASVKF